MRIDVEDIIKLEQERYEFNKEDLSALEFYKDGKKVEIDQEEIINWGFIGLNNIDFVMNKKWPE